MTDKRVILRADIVPSAKKELERVCEQRGMTQLTVLSRIVEFMSQQGPENQAYMLGLLPESEPGKLVRGLLANLHKTW